MKVRYLTTGKELLAEKEETLLPRKGENVVGFGDSYEVKSVCYFYNEDGELDRVNIVLVSEIEAIKERYLEMSKWDHSIGYGSTQD